MWGKSLRTYNLLLTGHICVDRGISYHFLTSVPPVITRRPRQGVLEWVYEVEDSPSQHHNVIDVQIDHNHLGCKPHPCREREFFTWSVDVSCSFLELQFDLEGAGLIHKGYSCCFALYYFHCKALCIFLFFLPWNMGHIFLHAVTPPSLVYWPNAVSRKNTGMPQQKRNTQ